MLKSWIGCYFFIFKQVCFIMDLIVQVICQRIVIFKILFLVFYFVFLFLGGIIYEGEGVGGDFRVLMQYLDVGLDFKM